MSLLKEYVSLNVFKCGFPLFPENDVNYTDFNFGENIIEINYNRKFEDITDRYLDSIYSSCVYYSYKILCLDFPSQHRLMCEACFKIKGKSLKGNNNVTKKKV